MRIVSALMVGLVVGPDGGHVVGKRDVGGETREVDVGHPDVERLHPGGQGLGGLWVGAVLQAHGGSCPC